MIEVGLPPLRESRTLRSPEADRLTIDSPAKVLPTCWSSSAGVDDVKLHDLHDQLPREPDDPLDDLVRPARSGEQRERRRTRRPTA